MAKLELLIPIIFHWEGGKANVKNDRGGATNMGVTISTWRSMGYDKDGDGDIDVDDLNLATREDVINIMRKGYWDRWRADNIINQSLANILVDWVWASGAHGIKIPQRLLGSNPDGIVGQKTLAAINAVNARNFFEIVKAERLAFVSRIVENDPSQGKFLKGWQNRINSFVFKS